MNDYPEKDLLAAVKQGNEQAFEQIFRQYYGPLCSFAAGILQDDAAAEEVVQDFFVKFWEGREHFSIDTSLRSYLFRSVKNRTLNVIKHEKTKLEHAKKVIEEAETIDFDDHYLEPDLQETIEKSIAELPDKRREIFRLSREEGLKYREIAEKLNISIKTVEAQMGLAIRFLREKLKRYNSFLFFLTGTKRHPE